MTIDDVKAELARGQAEAVRMLDAWLSSVGGRELRISRDYASRTYCLVLRDGLAIFGRFSGDSPEACRANAAEAIRSEIG